MPVPKTRAVFFDVDFTLIYPGPTFQAEGYVEFCARHNLAVDPSRFDEAVRRASFILDRAQDGIYDPELFIRYTRQIVEQMGGSGPGLGPCSREIYQEWAACQHFHLYEDVPAALRRLHDAGVKIGLISNTHRCLASLQSHFDLEGLVSAAISSSEHGYMKPHPSIFEAGLRLVGVAPGEAVMVGDSLKQDIEGAQRVGMRGVLVARSGVEEVIVGGVPVIGTLRDLPQHL